MLPIMSSALPGKRLVAISLGMIGLILADLAAAEDGEQKYRDGHYEEAISWWRHAAEAGDATAAYRLGVVYMDGAVARQDYGEARKWYFRAAAGGNRDAQFELGTLYDNGFGVRRSIDEAFRWYSAAAARGHPLAQYNLAVMYEDGEAVAQELVEAYKWYALAQRGGFLGTERGSREQLAPRLGAAEIEKAEVLAQQFEPME
jgi:TPR repeat protein